MPKKLRNKIVFTQRFMQYSILNKPLFEYINFNHKYERHTNIDRINRVRKLRVRNSIFVSHSFTVIVTRVTVPKRFSPNHSQPWSFRTLILKWFNTCVSKRYCWLQVRSFWYSNMMVTLADYLLFLFRIILDFPWEKLDHLDLLKFNASNGINSI